MSLKSVAQKYGVGACVDCDRCGEVCPVDWADERFSPAALARDCLADGPLSPAALHTLWTCTACRACVARCGEAPPDFAAFVLEARQEAYERGHRPPHPYRGALHATMRMTADDRYRQRRQRALPAEVADRMARKRAPGGALLLTGMAPYLSAVVSSELGEAARESVLAGFALLERLGYEPTALCDEAACGHDFLWTGQRDRFREHARRLSGQINETQAGLVVTPSQIVAETLRHDYPAIGYPIEGRVMTLTELLASRAKELAAEERVRPSGLKVCLHAETRRPDEEDGIQALQQAVAVVSDTEIVDLPADGPASHTVGVQGFSVCGGWAAALQNRLLGNAQRAGADCLLTSCATAAIHLRCACRQGSWRRANVEVLDGATFVYRHLENDTQQRAES